MLPNAEMNDPNYRKENGISVVESDVVYLHGAPIDYSDDVPERIELIVGTKTMPREDWIKSRKFAWMVSLFYFNKLLHVPLTALHYSYDLSWDEIFEEVMTVGPRVEKLKFIFSEMDDFIDQMFDGNPELKYGAGYLDIYWYLDEWLFIEICHKNLNQFYDGAMELLSEIVNKHDEKSSTFILKEALELNRWLLKLPNDGAKADKTLSSNIFDYYKSCINAEHKLDFTNQTQTLSIQPGDISWDNLQDWCRFVVWRGSQKGLYLYENVYGGN